jgi:hypothetical protein
MRSNRSIAAALAVVLLTLAVGISGCGKPNPLDKITAPVINPPTDSDTVCVLYETTPSPPDTIPGTDSYLGSPDTKSLVVSAVVFGGDSSTVDVIWHLRTIDRANYEFSIIAVDNTTGDVRYGIFDGGATRLAIGYRQVDTTVVTHFRTGDDGNTALGHQYRFYTVWNGANGTSNATGTASVLCHEAGPTWFVYRQWDYDCEPATKH